MNRLYDIITMVVKYQIITMDEPRQLLDITINHLEGIKKIVGKDGEAYSMIEKGHQMVRYYSKIL